LYVHTFLTDSSTEFYLGFKSWLPKWLKNGFTTAAGKHVKNAPLIRYLSALLNDRVRNGHEVRLQYIQGHEGNEGADRLAGQGAEMPEVEERGWQELEKALRAKYDPAGFPLGFWVLACLILVSGFFLNPLQLINVTRRDL
jgi:hypothetical protein